MPFLCEITIVDLDIRVVGVIAVQNKESDNPNIPSLRDDESADIDLVLTGIGTFCFTWSLAWWLFLWNYGDKKFPILGSLTVPQAATLTIPILTACLIFLYLLVLEHNGLALRTTRLERIPPAFGRQFKGHMLSFRLVIMLAFFVIPTVTLSYCFIELVRMKVVETPAVVYSEAPHVFVHFVLTHLCGVYGPSSTAHPPFQTDCGVASPAINLPGY